MNMLEYQMIDVLKKLKEQYGVFEIKAEFEAEGSRMEEMMRLKDVTTHVGLPIIVKIGGAEAVTDVYNALSIGVKGIVAPMIETTYALSKYVQMILTMVAEDNAKDIEFGFNLETKTAAGNLELMLTQDIRPIRSVTFGRVDYIGSCGFDRKFVENDEVARACDRAFTKIKERGLRTALGGAISTKTLPLIKRLEGVLDKYETRKVVFPASSHKYGENALLEAIRFELLWLQSKRRYYSRIKVEDENRIMMLEKRLGQEVG